MICYKCGAEATKLCDGRVVTTSFTCDRPLCQNCAHQAGQGIACSRGKGRRSYSFTIDYCDECHPTRTRKPCLEDSDRR